MFKTGMPNRRWRILAALTLIVVGALTLDWWQLNRETRQLLDAMEESEAAMVGGIESLEETMSSSDLSKLGEGGLPYERQQAEARLRADVSAVSASALAVVQETGARVEDVGTLPWHGSLRKAQEAYLDHNDAWVRYLQAVTADPAKLGDNVLSADIKATFQIAHRRVDAALPMVSLHNAEQRVEAIFEE